MLTELELPVRPLSQHVLHPTAPDEENKACWYASALMVLGYRGVPPTSTVTNVHTLARKWKNDGVFPHELWRLAQEVGLEHANLQAVLPQREATNWRHALDTLGPLIVIVGGHAIVVRGIVRQGLDWHVVYNDPLPGARRTMVLSRFRTLVNPSLPVLYRRSGQQPPMAQMRPVANPLG